MFLLVTALVVTGADRGRRFHNYKHETKVNKQVVKHDITEEFN